MADSNFRGPVNSMGALEVDAGTASVMPLDGPSTFYQGTSFPDLRSAPFAKDGFRPGQQAVIMSLNDFYSCDNIPQGATVTTLATGQSITAATAMTLLTATVGASTAGNPVLAMGVPIIPSGTTGTVSVIALDFGFTTGTTVANSTTINVPDSTLFTQNQWIIVGGAGNSGKTTSLVTQVASITNLTTILVSPAPVAALNAPIGGANLFGSDYLPPATQFGPSAPTAVAHSARLQAGFARVLNPRETLCRNVSVTGQTTSTATFTVTGYDVHNNLMTELLSVISTTGITTTYGKKAFKYISSITPVSTVTGTYSVGLGDVFGVFFRADEFEQTQVWWQGVPATSANGFTAAALGTASATTGDVRGTIQLSTRGSLGTSVSSGTTNGTSRLVIVQNPGVWNMISGTPTNLIPMYGWPQSTT